MNMRLHISLVILLVSCFFTIKAQDNLLKDYAPVAPTPASLGKYGDIPVSYHTGIPDISIPIHTLTEGSISVPISLSYHASGIRVQETASWVGLGWALNAGGVITRTVQGAPDERGNLLQANGYYKDYGNGITRGYGPPNTEVETGRWDLEPDIFSFNIGGYSGKFFFDKTRKIHIVPQQDVKIEEVQYINGNGTLFFGGWIVTDPQGVRYHFAATDDSMNMDNYVEKTVSTNDPAVPERAATWYMSKIESADRKDVINFTYTEEKYAFWDISSGTTISGPTACPTISLGQAFKTRVIGKRLTTISSSSGSVEFIGDNSVREDLSGYTYCVALSCLTHYNTEAKALKTIKIKDKTSACLRQFDFNYSYNISAPGTLPLSNRPEDDSDCKRLILDSVTESACGSPSNNKTHSFEYFDLTLMPRRACADQDHWGYYNAKNNTSMEPGWPYLKTSCNNGCYGGNWQNSCVNNNDTQKREPSFPAMRNGTLKKITFPTGGSSTFDYEGHTFWGADTTCTETTHSQASLTGGSCTAWITGDYTFVPTQSQIDNGSLELKWEPYNSNCNFNGSGTIEIRTCTNCSPFWTASTSGVGYFKLNTLGLVAGQSYKIRLISNGGITSYRFYTMTRTTVPTNKLVGGLRIKTITTKDGTTSNDIIKSYNYHDSSIPTQSSGKLLTMPIYASTAKLSRGKINLQNPYDTNNSQTGYEPGDSTAIFDNGFTTPGCPSSLDNVTSIFASSPLKPMQTTMGSHIGYKSVLVTETNNGKARYTYNIGGDYENEPWRPEGSPFTPPPFEPLLGKPVTEEYYDNNDNFLLEKLFTYTTFSTNVIGIARTGSCYGDFYTVMDAMKLVHVDKDGDPHITDQIRPYTLNTGYALLTKTTERTYNTDFTYQEKITDITYSTANGHLQKTTEDITDADGTIYRTKYKYAKDFACPTSGACDETNANANAEGKAILAMRKRNMVAIPIEQTTWVNRPGWGAFRLTGATYFRFDKVNTDYNNLKLLEVYQVRPATPMTNFTEATVSTSGVFSKNGNYALEYNFRFSDQHGRLLSQWKQNDPANQQYIWSHNNKLPIAKIINAEENEVAFTSFEQPDNTFQGSWSFPGSGGGYDATAGNFISGRVGFNLSPARTVVKNSLPAGKYVVSGWHKDGSFVVNGTTVSTSTGGQWKYAEREVT
ncbi:MAG TPA: hypothetical protein DCF33_06650, partial [Saprospirales bacterium]|nr:hypothetical protein [Saprospirales bacterium]